MQHVSYSLLSTPVPEIARKRSAHVPLTLAHWHRANHSWSELAYFPKRNKNHVNHVEAAIFHISAKFMYSMISYRFWGQLRISKWTFTVEWNIAQRTALFSPKNQHCDAALFYGIEKCQHRNKMIQRISDVQTSSHHECTLHKSHLQIPTASVSYDAASQRNAPISLFTLAGNCTNMPNRKHFWYFLEWVIDSVRYENHNKLQ